MSKDYDIEMKRNLLSYASKEDEEKLYWRWKYLGKTFFQYLTKYSNQILNYSSFTLVLSFIDHLLPFKGDSSYFNLFFHQGT